MYKLIANQYSKLFPPDKNRCAFVIKEIKQTSSNNASILDAGCANGDLAFELAAAGCQITGIDLDPTMIEIASRKAEHTVNAPIFKTRSLTELEGLGSFDAITCFGNTLPHLSSEAMVSDFLIQAAGAIHLGGRLIFQIINFDQLEDHNDFNFPDVDAGDSIFRRNYERRSDGRLDFRISLENKKTAEIIAEQTPLLPLMREKLIVSLQTAGFSDIKVYSDYNRTPADGMEFASIYSAASRF